MAASEAPEGGAWVSSEDEAPEVSHDNVGGGWATSDSEAEPVSHRPGHGCRGRRGGRGRGRGRPPGLRAQMREALARERAEAAKAAEEAIVVRTSWESHVRVVGNETFRDIATAIKASPEQLPPLSATAKKVHRRCNDPYVPRKQCGIQAEAEVLGCKNASYVRDLFTEFGAAVFVVARILFASFVSWLCMEIDEERLHGDCIFNMLAQDETSMKTGERGKQTTARKRRIRSKRKPEETAIQVRRDDEDCKDYYGVVVTKILQSESWVAFLVSRDDEFFLYLAELPTPLQRTAKGNHRQLFAAVSTSTDFPLMGGLVRRFDHQVSLDNADRGAPGLKMSRLYQFLYPSIPRLSGTGCFSHFTNSTQKSQMEIMEETMSGMVAFSLSVKEDGKWTEFRGNAGNVLFEIAKAAYDTPAPAPTSDVRIRTNRILTSLMDLEEPNVEERLRLIRLKDKLLCDISADELVVYIPGHPLAPETEKTHLQKFCKELSRDLVPKLFTPFQRQRWVLNLKRVRQLSLMGTAFGLLKKTVDRTFPANKTTKREGAWDSSDDEAGRKKDTPVVEKKEEKGSTAYWARKNEAARGDVRNWLRGPFWLPMLLIAAIVMEPLSHLMQTITDVGSDGWERRQMYEWIDLGQRKFRVTEAHSGAITATFYQESRDLLKLGSKWLILPEEHRTYMMRSYAYACVSRGIGGIFHYIDQTCQGYPWKLFRLIDDRYVFDTALREIMDDDSCLWDPFTAAFRLRFPTRKEMSSKQCVAVLCAIALMIRTCVSRIECRHAAVRRLLCTNGHTWVRDLATTSSDWIISRNRIIEQAGLALGRLKPPEKLMDVLDSKKRKKTRAGPYRAFLSEFLSRPGVWIGSGLLKEAAARYRAIRDENGDEWRRLQEKGRQGLMLARAGQAPFDNRRQRHCQSQVGRDVVEEIVGLPPADNLGEGTISDDDVVIIEPTPLPDTISATARADMEHQKEFVPRLVQGVHDLEEEILRKTNGYWDAQVQDPTVLATLPFTNFDESGVRPRITHLKVRHPDGPINFQVTHWIPPTSTACEKWTCAGSTAQKATLTKSWETMHRLRTDEEAAASSSHIPDAKTTPTVKICFVAGFCLCKLPEVRFAAEVLIGWLRRTVCKGSLFRRVLEKNMLVLRLGSTEHDRIHWWHPCFQNLTTWHAEISPLLPETDELLIEEAIARGRVALRSPDDNRLCMTNWWRAFQTVEFALPWTCSLYTLDSSPHKLRREMKPEEIVVESLDSDVVPIWGGRGWWITACSRRTERSSDGWHSKPKKQRSAPSALTDTPSVSSSCPIYTIPIADFGDIPDEFHLDKSDDISFDEVLLPSENLGPFHEELLLSNADGDADADDNDTDDDARDSEAGDESDDARSPSGVQPSSPAVPREPSPTPPPRSRAGWSSAPDMRTPDRQNVTTDDDGWIHVPCGTGHLVYKPGTKKINARCGCMGHVSVGLHGRELKCGLHKNGWRGRSKRGNGRPLGLLVLWLDHTEHAELRSEHDDLKTELAKPQYWLERRLARDWLKQQEGVAGLFAEERDQAEDEDDSEPEFIN